MKLARRFSTVLVLLAISCGVPPSEDRVETESADEALLPYPTTSTDLYMKALSASRNSSGITITYQIGNNSLSAAGASTINFYASTDSAFGSDDVARPLGGARSIPSLAARGSTTTATFTVAWPAGFTGRYVVYSIANTDAITTNNRGAFVLPADLAITSINFTRSGSTMYIDYALKNLSAYVGAPASVTRATYVGGTTTLLSCLDNVPALAPNQVFPATGTRRLTCALPAVAVGSYVKLELDYTNLVPETDEYSNNLRWTYNHPDLIVDTASVIRSGQTLYIDYALKNASFIPSTGSVTRMTLVGSPPFTLLSCVDNIPALSGNQRYPATGTRRVTCTAPTGAIGAAIDVAADYNKAVVEAIETNNSGVPTFLVPLGPAFEIWHQVGGNTTYSSGRITGKINVRNSGSMSAGASYVGLKLSGNYPTTGNYLVCNYPVPALAAGASVNLTVSCVVPSTVPAGNYYVQYWADNLNAVREANELGKYPFTSIYITKP